MILIKEQQSTISHTNVPNDTRTSIKHGPTKKEKQVPDTNILEGQLFM